MTLLSSFASKFCWFRSEPAALNFLNGLYSLIISLAIKILVRWLWPRKWKAPQECIVMSSAWQWIAFEPCRTAEAYWKLTVGRSQTKGFFGRRLVKTFSSIASKSGSSYSFPDFRHDCLICSYVRGIFPRQQTKNFVAVKKRVGSVKRQIQIPKILSKFNRRNTLSLYFVRLFTNY